MDASNAAADTINQRQVVYDFFHFISFCSVTPPFAYPLILRIIFNPIIASFHQEYMT
ncbi:hypothetical protein SK3146_00589 [Paenibacillus konkukensis]|uniref:Uncharacterized protein n=1 Tax=Paenibacillus konkukensis TaxID=2020716 RepID=A0ABY4RIS4_9BACL|nr:hypothetical protein SK3146_00589 [Paenibacillus konkukensis]